MLSPGPRGGVVTWSRGREVLSPGLGGGRCCDLVAQPPPPPRVEVTHACENITFARFATRAVINRLQIKYEKLLPSFILSWVVLHGGWTKVHWRVSARFCATF